MTFELPKLSYELDALEPYISKETMEYHYGKHHQTYVTNLNNLIIWTEFQNMSLEEIIKKSPAWPIFNNAAQVWNHTFYFTSLNKVENKVPNWVLLEMVNRDFWNFEEFKTKFNDMALKNFWSGWTWLVLNTTWNLEIINTSNAWSILTMPDKKALLTCDIWEHAYYIDYRNARAKYLENFWNVIDWVVIEGRV